MRPCRQHYTLVRYQYFTYVTNVFTVNSPFFPDPHAGWGCSLSVFGTQAEEVSSLHIVFSAEPVVFLLTARLSRSLR